MRNPGVTGAKSLSSGFVARTKNRMKKKLLSSGRNNPHAEPANQGPHHRAEHVVGGQHPDWKGVVHQPARSAAPPQARGMPNRPSSRYAASEGCRLRSTMHDRRRKASRRRHTRRSLVPSRRKPLSETWLNRPRDLRAGAVYEDRRGSRRLAPGSVPPRKSATKVAERPDRVAGFDGYRQNESARGERPPRPERKHAGAGNPPRRK